jgi:hypothetical protein
MVLVPEPSSRLLNQLRLSSQQARKSFPPLVYLDHDLPGCITR